MRDEACGEVGKMASRRGQDSTFLLPLLDSRLWTSIMDWLEYKEPGKHDKKKKEKWELTMNTLIRHSGVRHEKDMALNPR